MIKATALLPITQVGGNANQFAPKRIDPKKNFLLSRATELCKIKEDHCVHILYKLHNGVLAVFSSSDNPLCGDKIEPISGCKALMKFEVGIEVLKK